MRMHSINPQARNILEHIISKIPETGHLKLEKPSIAIMPLSVEWIGNRTLSISHFYIQNGDLMRDPEVTFYKSGNSYFPATYQQDNLGLYQEAILFDEQGTPERFNPKLQKSLVEFVDSWFENIVWQFDIKI